MAHVEGNLTHIGYVPKTYSRLVSSLLTCDTPVRAEVTAFDLSQSFCLVHLFLEKD
jgi:hypothetical protein